MANRREHHFAPAPVGHESHTACETRRGFVLSCTRKKIRVLCPVCEELRAIAKCTRILAEREESVIYRVGLEICGHERTMEVAVSRTPSGRKKLAEEKERAKEFADRQPLLDELHDGLDG